MANKINTNDIGSFVSSFLVEHLIGGRYQDVIQGRYGLKSGEPQTLQAIGDRYGITRERVRQIEALALSSLKAKAEASPYFKSFIQKSIGHLKAVGGAQKEELFFTNLHKTVGDRGQVISFANQARLLLELSGKFSSYKDSYNKDWHCYWYLSDADAKKSQSFVNKVVSTLNERKEEVLTSSKFNEVVNSLAKTHAIAETVAKNYLTISKKFHTSPFDVIGLADWSEVNPRTARDWAYVILKKEKSPMHFRELYEAISKHRKNKRTNLQTVHNELIKDNRFVLVGRGLYGLKEFGLIPGTAKEIIAHVLKQHGPMKPKEIVSKVLAQRMIKEATVMINLQNQKHFNCLDDGRYALKEA